MGSGNDDEQVEQLLRAAQDELMLKLSIDSHISHGSLNYLDSDLNRRFQALRSRPSSTSTTTLRNPAIPQSQSRPNSSSDPKLIENISIEGESKAVLGDDLAARFSALKASLPSSVSPPPSSGSNGFDDEDEEDEVEKLIQWAKDAARLDPSPPSDEDEDEDGDCTSDEDSDDRRNERRKNKKA